MTVNQLMRELANAACDGFGELQVCVTTLDGERLRTIQAAECAQIMSANTHGREFWVMGTPSRVREACRKAK